MRAIKVTVLAAVAAAALAAAPAPASAGPHWHGHHGWGHHGGWGWGGPALVFGLAGAAIAAGAAANACTDYVPVRDRFGNVIGRRPVNVC